MIQSKKDYLYYLACDKIALQQKRNHPRFMHDTIWTFERLMRKCEYFQNCKHGLFYKIILKWLTFRYVRLSQHLGFSIGFNTCGPGLCLEHYGCIINPLAELSQRILDSSNGLVVFVVNVL